MTPPPCTCGETATGLVVEGHLHPYCAWQAERARAEALRAMLANFDWIPHIAAALAADREGRRS